MLNSLHDQVAYQIVLLFGFADEWSSYQFASDSASDSNECTRKGLCEVATEVTDGNKLWSTTTTSTKHVSFTQELGMNCGLVERKDPCDTGPNEYKIKQLYEKATLDKAGTKSWNTEAEAYVVVAKEYELSCDVVEGPKAEAEKCKGGDTKSMKCRPIPIVPSDEETQVSAKCSRDNTSKCSNHYICAYASGPPKKDGWTIMTAWQPYVREAKRRGLTCGVKE